MPESKPDGVWWKNLEGQNLPFVIFGDMAEFKPPQRREVLRAVKAVKTAPKKWKEYGKMTTFWRSSQVLLLARAIWKFYNFHFTDSALVSYLCHFEHLYVAVEKSKTPTVFSFFCIHVQRNRTWMQKNGPQRWMTQTYLQRTLAI